MQVSLSGQLEEKSTIRICATVRLHKAYLPLVYFLKFKREKGREREGKRREGGISQQHFVVQNYALVTSSSCSQGQLTIDKVIYQFNI